MALAPQRTTEPIWPLHATLAAALAMVLGLIWDISWHRSIGRDTFWSPPHLLEQLAALVAGVTCGWLVLRITFRGSAEQRAAAVGFWGFRGPLGAWVCIWGTLMMIASAPFDNWWHNAYGLDVRVMSPPHMVLAWGMGGILIGAMLMALARQNRASAEEVRRLEWLYLGAAAVMVAMHATTLIEEAAFPNQMHSARFYVVTGLVLPAFVVGLARPVRGRWGATRIAALYMGLALATLWALQLTPAQPRLAPIFNAVTHMVPPPFPLLLVAPALAVDWVLARPGNDWARSAWIGVAWVAAMVAAHWFFADFMLAPAARNLAFGADQWDYNIVPGAWQHEFWQADDAAGFARGIARATLLTAASARLGLWAGQGMAQVQR